MEIYMGLGLLSKNPGLSLWDRWLCLAQICRTQRWHPNFWVLNLFILFFLFFFCLNWDQFSKMKRTKC